MDNIIIYNTDDGSAKIANKKSRPPSHDSCSRVNATSAVAAPDLVLGPCLDMYGKGHGVSRYAGLTVCGYYTIFVTPGEWCPWRTARISRHVSGRKD